MEKKTQLKQTELTADEIYLQSFFSIKVLLAISDFQLILRFLASSRALLI